MVLGFSKLKEMKEVIEPKIAEIENDPSETLDADTLQRLITTVMDLLEKLEKSDFTAGQCNSRI